MGLYILLLLFFGFGFLWLVLTQPAQKTAALLTNGGPILLVAVGCLLTFFRRGAFGLPLIFIGLSWLRRNRSRRPSAYSGGRKSTVRSSNLEMELDHDSGEIDGTVLKGRLQGFRLSHLNLEDLLRLYQEIYSDSDSIALLESFLERYHPHWRENVDGDSYGKQGNGSGFGEMSRQEALQILGVERGASDQEIDEAWRRLIKKVHPDHGGSAFLTAKINAARDVLLD